MKQCLLLLFMTVPCAIKAQVYPIIPNPSFEQWIPGGGVAPGSMYPAGWTSFNPGTANQIVPPVSRSADATDSSWSVVMRPWRGLGSFGFYIIRLKHSDTNTVVGFVVPKRMRGMYKFAKDSLTGSVRIDVCFNAQGGSLGGPPVCSQGGGFFYPYLTNSWTPFAIPLDTTAAWALKTTAYYLEIIMVTADTSAHPVTFLQLDALRFEYDTASTGFTDPLSRQPSVVISPNPSKGMAILSWGKPLTNDATMLIQSLAGQTLLKLPVRNGDRSVELNTSLLPSGQYVVHLISPGTYLPPARLVVM